MFTLPLHVIGCSHENADASIIGRLGIAESELSLLLKDVYGAGIPCVLLSTCNRTELYWWGERDAAPLFKAWVIGRLGSLPPRLIERRDADLAVRHLFAVAAGLRSQRLGEPEILGQVRRAWMSARDAGVTNSQLDSVMQRGIQAGRRIRAHASASEWGRSLGEAATEFIDQLVGEDGWKTRRAVVVGTGSAAESSAESIAKRCPVELTIMSRSDDRAGALATTLGALTSPWTSRLETFMHADVVIFATRTKSHVVKREEAEAIMSRRSGPKAVWLDLGVPPNVEQGSEAPIGLDHFTLSDLPQELTADDEGAIIAEGALQSELARFASELHRRVLAEQLPAMESIANDVARDTVRRLRISLGRSATGDDWYSDDLDAAATEAAKRMARVILREIGSVNSTIQKTGTSPEAETGDIEVALTPQ